VNSTQENFPLSAFWAERVLALRWSADWNHWWQKMLRILNTESSEIPGMVLFPTGFTPKGTLQGDKGGVTPPAAEVAVGVGVGVEEGGSLKTCSRIENSGAKCLEELHYAKSLRIWWALLVECLTSLMLNSANCSLTCSVRVSGSA
jgi:hypothetical protein